MPRTVLVTGITGFIAKRIARDLLAQGDSVRGTLRNSARAQEVRDAVADLGADALARLDFAPADLTADAGWAEAIAGVDAVIHTASPFPLDIPKDENVLIRPAVEGTERVLRAAQAAGVTRVVVTSSMEAVMHGTTSNPMTEADWSTPQAKSAVPYTRSKILGEKAVWAFGAAHPEMQLTTILPGMVLGTPTDRHTGSSVGVIARFLSGKDPMVPDFSLPVVALEDVSAAHVRALDRPESIGNRYILAERFMGMPDLARLLAATYPDRRIATRIAPRFLIALLALFDKQLAIAKHLQGLDMHLSHAAATRDLGLDFISADDAVLRTARFLVDQDAA